MEDIEGFTEVNTKSPGRQGLCARISDNAPPERLPRRDACISFGTVPRVPISAPKERFYTSAVISL